MVVRPKPSSTDTAGRLVSPASSRAGVPADSASSRLSMSTYSPDSGSDDQLGLAVMWNITFQPAPMPCAVISGVPSASRAQTRLSSSAEGSASTWRVTVTSPGISKPLKGELALKLARCCGCPQAMALPR